jgi:large subunit ribosomal protein L19e
MELKLQKRLASKVLKCSPKRVRFDSEQLTEIKEGITKGDIRSLVKGKAIQEKQKKGVSRFAAKARQKQRKKGRQRGAGTKKGTKNARSSKKREWINKIRLQRTFLRKVRENDIVTKGMYRSLYLKAKGGFFRSLRHMKMYMNEHGLFTEKIEKK